MAGPPFAQVARLLQRHGTSGSFLRTEGSLPFLRRNDPIVRWLSHIADTDFSNSRSLPNSETTLCSKEERNAHLHERCNSAAGASHHPFLTAAKLPLWHHSQTPGSNVQLALRSFSAKAPSSEGRDEDNGEEDILEETEGWSGSAHLYETILAEVVDEGRVGLLTINRPDKLNALSSQVMDELQDALEEFDADPDIKAIILTGSGKKAFAAGADIKEMQRETFVSAYMGRLLSGYERATAATKKPIIAAVNGYALGGGCELAMMCDVILAGENALFGQPETNLGVIPGMGGTQRLIRAVGKSRAMEMILTGAYFMDAKEAVARGLASRVVEGGPEELVDAAIELAKKIAQLSSPVVAMAKEAVNSANDFGLSEGVKKENLMFAACFGLEDQKEAHKTASSAAVKHDVAAHGRSERRTPGGP